MANRANLKVLRMPSQVFLAREKIAWLQLEVFVRDRNQRSSVGVSTLLMHAHVPAIGGVWQTVGEHAPYPFGDFVNRY